MGKLRTPALQGVAPHPHPVQGGTSASRTPPQSSCASLPSRRVPTVGSASRVSRPGRGLGRPSALAQTRGVGVAATRRRGSQPNPADTPRRFPWQPSPRLPSKTPDTCSFSALGCAPPPPPPPGPPFPWPGPRPCLPLLGPDLNPPTPGHSLPGPRRRPSAAGSEAPGAPWSRGRLGQRAPRPSAVEWGWGPRPGHPAHARRLGGEGSLRGVGAGLPSERGEGMAWGKWWGVA